MFRQRILHRIILWLSLVMAIIAQTQTSRTSSAASYLEDGNLSARKVGALPQEITGGWGLAVTTQTTPPPATPTWSITGDLNVARDFHAATLLPDGKVLIIDGNSAELYDPATGTWTPTGSPKLVHFYPTATVLPNGKVLVVSGPDTAIPNDGGAELYDPSAGT